MTTQHGSATKPRGRTSAVSHPSPPAPARPTRVVASTRAGTVKRTTRSGGSCSPGWAKANLAPSPTCNAASPKDAPNPRSSGPSSATSPARSSSSSPLTRRPDRVAVTGLAQDCPDTLAGCPSSDLPSRHRHPRRTAWPNKSVPFPSGPSLVCQHLGVDPLTTHRSVALALLRDAAHRAAGHHRQPLKYPGQKNRAGYRSACVCGAPTKSGGTPSGLRRRTFSIYWNLRQIWAVREHDLSFKPRAPRIEEPDRFDPFIADLHQVLRASLDSHIRDQPADRAPDVMANHENRPCNACVHRLPACWLDDDGTTHLGVGPECARARVTGAAC